jgi:ribonuclease P protein component
VLARENRLVTADDFRTTTKSGRKFASTHLVIYLNQTDAHTPRFGFIVAKTVGNAVVRNLVKRRLRAIARATIANQPTIGCSVVVRAQASAATASFEDLQQEFFNLISKGLKDQNK